MQGVIFNRSLAIKQKVENGVAALLHAKSCFVHDLGSLSHCSSSGLPVFYFYVFFFEKMELKILDFSSAGAVDARLLPPALVAPPTKKNMKTSWTFGSWAAAAILLRKDNQCICNNYSATNLLTSAPSGLFCWIMLIHGCMHAQPFLRGDSRVCPAAEGFFLTFFVKWFCFAGFWVWMQCPPFCPVLMPSDASTRVPEAEGNDSRRGDT